MDNKTLDLKYTALLTLFTRFLRMVGLYALFRNTVKPNRFHEKIMSYTTCLGLSANFFMLMSYEYFRDFRELREILILSQLFRFYLLENLEEVCKIYQIESNEASEIIVKCINRNGVSSLMREWLNDFKNGKKLKIDYNYEKLLRTN